MSSGILLVSVAIIIITITVGLTYYFQTRAREGFTEEEEYAAILFASTDKGDFYTVMPARYQMASGNMAAVPLPAEQEPPPTIKVPVPVQVPTPVPVPVPVPVPSTVPPPPMPSSVPQPSSSSTAPPNPSPSAIPEKPQPQPQPSPASSLGPTKFPPEGADPHMNVDNGGYAGKNNIGGFDSKPYCTAYKAGDPLPFYYNALPLGNKGGIEKRGPELVKNKKLLNDAMAELQLPEELKPLLMAFSMIETQDMTLDQISDFMRAKSIQEGKCFGIMNINFGHRSYLGLDKELSTQGLNAKTDQYYSSTNAAEKETIAKEMMYESVRVFKKSFETIGVYCSVLFHRGGPTLFNNNDFRRHQDMHPQIFFDGVANTYLQLVKDSSLMTDDRRVWYNIHEV